ncbi:MAG: gamma-glutamyl-gamma-aminobutyrate hydrolase family protein [Anaerolineales bacterium]|nr:gamma-glutamyl-gamma-aminobutyrate hydrolase family protein [Anaerolineales bacterium]
MNPPLIGITTKRQTSTYGFPEIVVGESYVQAVLQAGGLPLLIPLGLPEDQIQEMVSSLDGLVFSGGGDIEPKKYGAALTPKVKTVAPDRDRVEIQLVREAIDKGTPFLGICRGLQVINVALGGTLYRDILEEHPKAIEHTYYPNWPWDHLAHAVKIQADSLLAEILGSTEVQTNSLHHQAIKQIASDLVPLAYAPDGIIEGVVLPEHPFGLGVQWHPEWLQAHESMRALFRKFVDEAKGAREA